jgi:hypothetical protein
VAVINNTILYSPADSSAPAAWFGPYVFLPQGNYSIDVTVKIDVSSPTNSSLLTLDVTANMATTVLASKAIYTSDVTGSWQVFSLNFTLIQPLYDIQFRGMYPAASVSLQGVTLVKSP